MAKRKIQMIPPGYTDQVYPETTASVVIEEANKRFMTDAERTKLSEIEAKAEVNNITDTDADLLTGNGNTTLHYHSSDRNRANHTGTQSASTISNFAATVRSTVLTGLSTATNAAITASDSVLSSLGKLQKQISDNLSTLTNHTGSSSNPHNVTKAQVGLGNADNTSDANKPISTAQQAALDLKAPLASPSLTGTPTTTTAAVGTNTNQIASTKFVTTAVANKTSVSGNAGTATKLATPRTINVSGGATGTATNFDGSANISIPITSLDATKLTGLASVNTSGNSATATKLATTRNIGLSGDVTGSVTFNGSSDATISAVVADDSHNHTSSTIRGAYAVASGTNTYTATVEGYTLVEGKSVKIKFTNANTGVSTLNINGLGAKSIRKGNGSTLSSGNIKAGQICNLVYTGSVFQLLGEGGEYGTATASDVLSGKTIGTEEGLVTGTMPNRGAVSQSLPINGSYTIPEGYHSGSGKVTQSIATKGAQTYAPSTSSRTISAGQYLSGTQTISPITGNATRAQVLSGQTFNSASAGIAQSGTMTNRGAVTKTLTTQGSSYTVPIGYHSGSGKVTASFSNLSAGNIKSGVNVGGVIGKLNAIDDWIGGDLSKFSDGSKGLFELYETTISLTSQVITNAILFKLYWYTSTNPTAYFTSPSPVLVYYTYLPDRQNVMLSSGNFRPYYSTDFVVIYNPDRLNITLNASTTCRASVLIN